MKRKQKIEKQPDKLLLELFEHGVTDAKPKNILGKFFKFNKKSFSIKTEKKYINYNNVNKIYPICIGKASVDMAETSKKILKKFKGEIVEGIECECSSKGKRFRVYGRSKKSEIRGCSDTI